MTSHMRANTTDPVRRVLVEGAGDSLVCNAKHSAPDGVPAYLLRHREIESRHGMRDCPRPPDSFPELRLSALQQWVLRVRTGQVQ